MAKGKSKKKLSKKEEKARKKRTILETKEPEIERKEPKKPTVFIPPVLTIREFSSKLNLPVTEVIKILMKNGIFKTINENIDWETAAIIADELGFEVKLEEVHPKEEKKEKVEREGELVPRPPVVTVMGHIDHGKTKLLDTIRQTDIVSKEAGGITQHIGAYQVEYKKRKITFIDTPGHEAFTAMRAHGANITDIVILVVAADEGVMPQTIEAYEHAKAASVPIIVAINKIDLPNANIPRVLKQLSDLGLVCEEMGGKTICQPISALENKNIDRLLEMILLLADLKNLRANPHRSASGVVIESHLDEKLGPVASLLIQDGTLSEGDFIVCGETWGRVRLIEDEHKQRLKRAGPSQPVLIAGLKNLPSFGQAFQVVPDEKTAYLVLADLKKAKKREETKEFKKGEGKELPIILKADVLGSLRAILDSLERLKEEGLKIILKGVGNISESDIMLASASKASIFAFRVKISQAIQKLAEEKGVKISHYEVIYDLLKDLEETFSGLKKPEAVLKEVGWGKVLRIFRSEKSEKIIGLGLKEGRIEKGLKVKIKRQGELIGEGKIISLQIEKEPVDFVEGKKQCGIGLEIPLDLEEGDRVEFYKKI